MNFESSRVKLPVKNIIANFAGNGLVSLLGLVFTPVYLHFLGIEAYALIGFYLLLLGMLQMLDMGLSKTCNREMARFSEQPEFGINASKTLRTFEFLYWGVALLIAMVVISGSSFIADDWLNYEGLAEDEVRLVIIIIGCNLALQWPVSMYNGGIMGLENHVLLNVIASSFSIVRHIGASLLLWLVSPSIVIFFIWSAVVSLLQVVFLGLALWCLVRRKDSVISATFDVLVLKKIWRFSAGVAATQLLSVGIRQVDKIVLSKLLSLEFFGFYMLASLMASAIGFVSTPFSKAVYPRFTRLVAQVDTAFELQHLYHKSCECLSAIVLPVVVVVLLYAEEILYFWTQNQEVATNTAPLLLLLVISTGINALISLPYALQLAYGWSSLAMYQNLISLIIQVPLIFYFIDIMGAVGAAIPRIIHNISYVLILVPIMHSVILKGELFKWFSKDILTPLFVVMSACLPITYMARLYPEIPKLIVISVSLLSAYFFLYKLGYYKGLLRDQK